VCGNYALADTDSTQDTHQLKQREGQCRLTDYVGRELTSDNHSGYKAHAAVRKLCTAECPKATHERTAKRGSDADNVRMGKTLHEPGLCEKIACRPLIKYRASFLYCCFYSIYLPS
jgi:hypothetical protein